MLDARYWIDKKKESLVLSSISRGVGPTLRGVVPYGTESSRRPGQAGMQGLSFIDLTSLLKRQQLVTIKSRQGGLDINVKILAYIDG